MRICGIKTTHDGGMALIDDARLIFSTEMEKLDNNDRHAKIDDYRVVFEQLWAHGYRADDVDLFVFDGWYKTPKPRVWFGQEVEIALAPYRRGLVRDQVMAEYPGRVVDLDYVSFSHYAGHIAAGYCTSPAARRGADGLILVWDGWMFPFLYQVDYRTGQARAIGSPLPLIGNSYYELCRRFPPFDQEIAFPQELGLAGKIMAYVALGRPRADLVSSLRAAIWSTAKEFLGGWPAEDATLQRDIGIALLAEVSSRFDAADNDAADVIASIHHCLGDELLAGLERLIEIAPTSKDLTIVGGCGLNIKWNSAIRDSGLFREVWVPPFPNDAGSALGTACAAMLARTSHRSLTWEVYSGPRLRPANPHPDWRSHPCTIADLATFLVDVGEPVAVLSGRAELGPRALGHRSLIAPATDPAMRDRLNEIKCRESYRPIAPICLEHRAQEVFSPGTGDPYMLFDHVVRPGWAERVPAIVHLDGTARLQTVGPADDHVTFELLCEYERLTGIPVLCNTSANRPGAGFFPDVQSAMDWGGVGYIWSDGTLYRSPETERSEPT